MKQTLKAIGERILKAIAFLEAIDFFFLNSFMAKMCY